ncbi:MAG TPA: hypothetical protein VEX38_04530, partial [Fimbriimonadaceae bacterium]|nr:hypothetical protein [Fimbriimonadaceae bacterium]
WRAIMGPRGEMKSNLSLSPGTVGGIQIGSASYAENRWDDINSQGITNLQFGTPKDKPIKRFLFINDLGFNFGLDTATDRTAWVRENRELGFNGRIGSNSFLVGYKSQMHGSGFRGIDRQVKLETDQREDRFFSASVDYKMRHLPQDEPTMIRKINLTLRPSKNLTLSNTLLTNPEEQFRGDVILGSLTSPLRVNKWNLSYKGSENLTLGATWEERLNDLTRESSRITGVNLDLFKATGSPLSLFYGVEQKWGNFTRQTAHRYWLKFDQRPGPNQIFSIFAGNVSYEHSIADGFKRNNWTVQMNYQLKF